MNTDKPLSKNEIDDLLNGIDPDSSRKEASGFESKSDENNNSMNSEETEVDIESIKKE